MPTPSDPEPEAVVTVVRAVACHLCEDAAAALAELSGRYRFRVRYLDAADPAGRQLLASHRVAMFPLILVDGGYFSQGRLPRGKLRRLLQQRQAVAAAGTGGAR